MEHWKAIDGFDAYEVSDLGRVRRVTPDSFGRKTYCRLVKITLQGRYPYVALWNVTENKQRRLILHRLVAKAFIPNPKRLPEVNHLGPKTDCRAKKLEWRTRQGNELHVVQNSLKGAGINFEKRTGKWAAYYSPSPYKRKWLGRFNTKEEAMLVRQAAVKSMKEVL